MHGFGSGGKEHARDSSTGIAANECFVDNYYAGFSQVSFQYSVLLRNAGLSLVGRADERSLKKRRGDHFTTLGEQPVFRERCVQAIGERTTCTRLGGNECAGRICFSLQSLRNNPTQGSTDIVPGFEM
ncbi:hypothetical protein GCM10010987_64050 [Bradyrhizobium guangdongense]|uniref:Uncharacterized protein n=1 Tax=Bradyrhizobium guangdongense TaxID=1325090 RepID=A0AA88BC96_9BRAD|nr:hypothetical protein GCM10010987_64050 [Bradyrhizobium guangdongense]